MEIDIFKLGERYNLTKSEELALRYIINNTEKSLEIGVRGVAGECFASTSVVMNLSKKLGYKGFIDMIYRLELSSKSTSAKESIIESYCSDFSVEKGEKFQSFIKKRKNRPIFVNGVGFSEPISKYLCGKLMVLGYFAMMSEYMENVEREYEEKPLLIVVSKSGETSATLNLCQKASAKKVPVVVITGIKGSSMEALSELTFVIKNSNLLDDRNLEKNDFFGNTILFFEELVEKYLK